MAGLCPARCGGAYTPGHTLAEKIPVKTMIPVRHLLLVALGGALLTHAQPARAEFNYFVGLDDLPTLASGTYSGLANPNFNHLTFLWGHPSETNPSSSHYHSKGIFIYTGPNMGAGTAVTNSPSNYVPEGTLEPLELTLGTGIYAGKLISNPYTNPSDPAFHFSDLTIGSTQSLADAPAGSSDLFLFNSSNGRWNSAFEDADLHFELVSLTPGLNLGGLTALNIGLNNAGDDFHLGEGAENNDFSFTPVLWTEANAAPGIYEAAFKLVDETGTFGDSGVVRMRTEVVPEPSTALLLIGGVGMMAARRRRAALA